MPHCYCMFLVKNHQYNILNAVKKERHNKHYLIEKYVHQKLSNKNSNHIFSTWRWKAQVLFQLLQKFFSMLFLSTNTEVDLPRLKDLHSICLTFQSHCVTNKSYGNRRVFPHEFCHAYRFFAEISNAANLCAYKLNAPYARTDVP